jgi:hypothetical protein
MWPVAALTTNVRIEEVSHQLLRTHQRDRSIGVRVPGPDHLCDLSCGHGARLDTVLRAWRQLPAGKGGADIIARLANQVQEGDLMWTRDRLGRYWLCQITDPWRYDK